MKIFRKLHNTKKITEIFKKKRTDNNNNNANIKYKIKIP